MRQERVYGAFGQKVTLECITESHPNSINYWKHQNHRVPGGTIESVTMENVFKVVMQLVVRPQDPSDFGVYTCVGQNSYGKVERIIHLHCKYITGNYKISTLLYLLFF